MVNFMIFYEDKQYNFYELFNEKNGLLIRSNIIGTKKDATMRSFPELIDVGIMGKCHASNAGMCSKVGVGCYQNAINTIKMNMQLQNYEKILRESRNKVFQIALGGAGDPNKHENFEDILFLTKKYGIIPNMTTSGYNLLDNEINCIRKYCGAVAVSFYSRLIGGIESNDITINAIKKFVDAGCSTNIHYVISDTSIDEATYRLEHDVWPNGIESIIFILYKPVGLGVEKNIIKKDKRLVYFLNAAVKKKHTYRVGFDTCFTSALVKYKDCLEIASIDSCEAAKFSMYIDSEMNAYPCSFDNQCGKYKVSLNNRKIIDIWNSIEFNNFRKVSKSKCDLCLNSNICNLGCKLDLGIDLC